MSEQSFDENIIYEKNQNENNNSENKNTMKNEASKSRIATRRELIKKAGLVALASAGLNAASQAKSSTENTKNTPATDKIKNDLSKASWKSIKAQFPLDKNFIHMSGFLLASYPKPVAAAIERHRQALDNDPATYLLTAEHPAEQAVLKSAANYINARSEDIALIRSTTEGIALLYSGLDIRADQEILTSTHDHYATFKSLDYSSKRSGAAIKRISLYESASEAATDDIVDRIKKAISGKTRIIALTWVHSGTGVKLPIAEIAKVVASANKGRSENNRALLCIDGIHGFGIEDIDIQAMGCDFFIAGTHKWMFGPRGTGILWGSEQAWPHAKPTVPTFDQNAFLMWMGYMPKAPLNPAIAMSPGGTHAFEHRWAMNEAFDFHLAIGKAKVAERIHSLNSQLKQGMKAIPGVRLHTPLEASMSAGIIAFEIDKVGAQHSMQVFREHGIISTQAPYNPSYARLAPGLINNEQDITRCLEVIEKIS